MESRLRARVRGHDLFLKSFCCTSSCKNTVPDAFSSLRVGRCSRDCSSYALRERPMNSRRSAAASSVACVLQNANRKNGGAVDSNSGG